MTRARFHFEIDLEHRDQLAPIADDLTIRYGGAEVVWYEIVEEHDAMQHDDCAACGTWWGG
jgi:hypothetical protein